MAPGFFQKIGNFFKKVWDGAKRVFSKVAPIVKKVLPFVAPLIPGGGIIQKVADVVLPIGEKVVGGDYMGGVNDTSQLIRGAMGNGPPDFRSNRIQLKRSH